MLIDIEAYELMTEAEFTEHEKVIENGKRAFIEVGKALAEIRERKGYRLQYGTFEEYCLKRWGWSVSTGQRMIAATRVIDNIEQVENASPVTQIDYSKAALLASLTPEEQIEFVQEHDVFRMTKRELESQLKARKFAELQAKKANEQSDDLIAENQRLNKELSKIPEPKIVEVEVIPGDYNHLKEKVAKQTDELNHLTSAQISLKDTHKLRSSVTLFVNEVGKRSKQLILEYQTPAFRNNEANQDMESCALILEKTAQELRSAVYGEVVEING